MALAGFLVGVVVCFLALLLLSWSGRRSRRGNVPVIGRPTAEGLALDEGYAAALARRLIAAGALAGPATVWVGLRDARGTAMVRLTAKAAEPVAASPRLPLASITKVLVAHYAWELARRGAIDLRRPIGEYARFAGADPGIHRASLLDLLTHTAGAPRLPAGFAAGSPDPYASYTRQRLLDDLARQPLRRSAYCYSNFGYAAIGAILEDAAGAPLATAMEDFLRGLGLAGISFARPRDEEFATAGIDARGDRIWRFDAFAPAGGAFAPLGDLLTYAELLRTRAELAPLLFSWRAAPGGAVGLGWHLADRRRVELPWHNGQAGAFSSFLGFSREAGVTIAALGDAPIDLAPMLLEELAGASRSFLERS